MSSMNTQFLKELLNQISVSGAAGPVQAVVKQYMKEAADEIREDAAGNVICVLNPEAKERILVTAHSDEIGLVVTRIMENGRIRVIDRGGIIPKSYLGHQVQIMTEHGVCYGSVAAIRSDWDEKELKASRLTIDIGAESREEAERLVSVGDVITFDTHIRELAGGRFSARALDDRLGVFIIMEALKLAGSRRAGRGIYCGATVGEETTKNGAYWTSSRVHPDFAVVVDVTYATDYDGSDPSESGDVRLGRGPVLCCSPILSPDLNKQMAACAARAGIPIQWEAASRLTHTDADQIHFSGEGVPVVLMSIPLRYMHTPAEVADWKDVENCIGLLGEFLAEHE